MKSYTIGIVFLLIVGSHFHQGTSRTNIQNTRGTKGQIGVTEMEKYSETSRNCTIKVDTESINRFANWIEDEEMKYISFYLNFTDMHGQSVHINYTNNTFIPYEWVWTYAGLEVEAFNILQFPFDFDLLSCGLLSNYVKRHRPYGNFTDKYVRVDIMINSPNADCLPPLGSKEMDLEMQMVLQHLVQQTQYVNNSIFCYEVQYNIKETMGVVWWYLTHFFGVQRDYTGWKCCPSPSKQTKGCNISVKQTSYLWVTQIYGLLLACLSPLILYYIPRDKDGEKKEVDIVEGETDEWQAFSVASEVPEIRKEEWIYLSDNRYTASGILRKLCMCNRPSMTIKRIRRVIFVILSLALIFIQTILFYFIKMYNVKVRIDNDIPIGSLCIPFGYKACLKNSAYLFGGPIVFLPLYLFFFCLMVCIPSDIPELYLSSKELSECAHDPIYTFLYVTDGVLENRRMVRNHGNLQGYQKLAMKIQDRFSMILSVRFWKFFFKIWRRRFCKVNLIGHLRHIGSTRMSRSKFILVLVMMFPTVICWIVVSVLCICEIVLVAFYYGCPLAFFLKLSFTGFLYHVFEASSAYLGTPSRRYFLNVVLFGVTSFLILCVLVFTIFIGVFQFVAQFTFVIDVLSFTFVGLVVYPEIALTYVLAAFAILYYFGKCITAILDGYIILLDTIVKVSKRLQEEDWRPASYDFPDDEFRYIYVRENPGTGMMGVPKETFNEVVEILKPLRTQLICAFVKLFITGNIIYSTVSLLETFHKGKYVSLPTRIIALILVGLLPELLGMFKSKSREKMNEEKLEKCVETLVKKYWQTRFQLITSEAVA